MERRVVGKPFQKGQSGNPFGRPKIVQEVEALAREKTPIAMQTLTEIASNKKAPPAARVNAASILLDRGWGRPSQHITGNLGITLESLVLQALGIAPIAETDEDRPGLLQ